MSLLMEALRKAEEAKRKIQTQNPDSSPGFSRAPAAQPDITPAPVLTGSPEPGFPLGGDDRGRDLLSRLLVGSRQTLFVGVFATLFGLAGGLTLGTIAGAFGGWVDSLVMRIVDVMLSLPSLLLAFTIASLISRSLRFYLVAGLLWQFGPPIRNFVEKRLGLVTTLFVVVLVGGFVAIEYLF